MSWNVSYHPGVEDDLHRGGPAAVWRILKAIGKKLAVAPLQFGAPLSGNLSAFRKLRIGDYRVVYKVKETTVTVYVLAVGPRRDKEIYDAAAGRL
jgi:mRNA interferase RelE/StbE